MLNLVVPQVLKKRATKEYCVQGFKTKNFFSHTLHYMRTIDDHYRVSCGTQWDESMSHIKKITRAFIVKTSNFYNIFTTFTKKKNIKYFFIKKNKQRKVMRSIWPIHPRFKYSVVRPKAGYLLFGERAKKKRERDNKTVILSVWGTWQWPRERQSDDFRHQILFFSFFLRQI